MEGHIEDPHVRCAVSRETTIRAQGKGRDVAQTRAPDGDLCAVRVLVVSPGTEEDAVVTGARSSSRRTRVVVGRARRRTLASWGPVAAALVCLSTAGCGAAGSDCHRNADCPPRSLCRNGACVAGVDSARDGGDTDGAAGDSAEADTRPPSAFGGPCSAPTECEEGLFCNPTRRHCQPPIEPSLGEGACESGEDCRAGLVCNRASGRCDAPGTDGLPCGWSDDCAPTLTCNWALGLDQEPGCPRIPSRGPRGLCWPRGGQGALCGGNDDCLSGLRCNRGAGACASARAGAPGDPCGDDEDCAQDLECNTAAHACLESGTAEAGSACRVDGQDCAAGLLCNRQYQPPQCQPPGEQGRPCDGDEGCGQGLVCFRVGCGINCLRGRCAGGGLDADLGVTCEEHADCEPAETCSPERTPARCVAALREGDACRAGSECATDLACVLGVCRTPRQEGGICLLDYDCADGLACNWASGRCTRPGSLAEGADCNSGQSTLRCEAGLACLPSWDAIRRGAPKEGACTRATSLRAGEVCRNSPQCEADLVCNAPLLVGPLYYALDPIDAMFACPPSGFGVCWPPSPGLPCLTDLDCGLGFQCSSAAGGWMTCLEPVTAGGACEAARDCADGLTCEGAAEPGRCESSAAAGVDERCEDSVACGAGLVCFTGLCKPPGRAGDPCEQDEHCRGSLVCNRGVVMARREGIFAGDCRVPSGECQPPGDGAATCAGDGECAKGLVCVKDNCAYGACAAPGDVGSSCFRTDDCGSGLWCGPDGQCAARSASGGPCQGDPDCADGLFCAGASGCSDRLGVDDACDRGASDRCAAGLVCRSTDGSWRCQAPGDDGAACVEDESCRAGLRCIVGRCGTPRDVGFPCVARADCGAGLTCLYGRCKAARGLGEPCKEDAECAVDLRCGTSYLAPSDTGRDVWVAAVPASCELRGAVGDACAEDAHCASGLLCSEGDEPPVCATGQADSRCATASDCVAGLVCNSGHDPPVCAARSGSGSPCGEDADCANGLSCVRNWTGEGRLCAGPGGGGTPCRADDACAGDLVCNPADDPPRCGPSGDVGAVCRFDSQCDDALHCDADVCR